jgi:hypothetical protein
MNGAGSAVVGYLPAPACCYLRRPVGMSLASAMLRARKSYFNRPSATLLPLGDCRRSRPTSHSVDRASPQPSTSRPPAAGLRQSRASGGRAPLPASWNKRAMPSANKARSLLHVARGTTFWTGTRSYLAEHQGGAPVLLAGLGEDFRLRLDCGEWLACGAAIVSPEVWHARATRNRDLRVWTEAASSLQGACRNEKRRPRALGAARLAATHCQLHVKQASTPFVSTSAGRLV